MTLQLKVFFRLRLLLKIKIVFVDHLPVSESPIRAEYSWASLSLYISGWGSQVFSVAQADCDFNVEAVWTPCSICFALFLDFPLLHDNSSFCDSYVVMLTKVNAFFIFPLFLTEGNHKYNYILLALFFYFTQLLDNQYILNIFILHYSLINSHFKKLSTGCSNYVDFKICTIEICRLNCIRFHYYT